MLESHPPTHLCDRMTIRNRGDLPTPVKYSNPIIRDEYKKIEKLAEKKLINMAPSEFKEDYAKLIDHHYHSDDIAFIV